MNAPPSRVLVWTAHARPVLVAVGFTSTVLSGLAGPVLERAVLFVAAVLAVLVTAVDIHHAGRLCARCTRGAGLPDGDEVHRQRYWLALHHLSLKRRWILIVNTAPWVLFTLLPLPPWVAFGPMWLWLWAAGRAHLRHRPLWLWCPHCRGWWTGGLGVDVAAPVPPGVQVR